MTRTLANKDVLSGLMFVVFGIVGLWISRDLTHGSAALMGAGYMPRFLCAGLIILGAVIAAKSYRTDAPVGRSSLMKPLTVLLAIVLFGILLRYAGLFVTAFITVVVASMATRESGKVEVLLLAGGMAAFSVLLFVYGLGLPIRPWPF